MILYILEGFDCVFSDKSGEWEILDLFTQPYNELICLFYTKVITFWFLHTTQASGDTLNTFSSNFRYILVSWHVVKFYIT